MADYILLRKSRNKISTLLHTIMNIALGVGSVFATIVTGSPLIGIILVIISKWRVFAVRPRYWFTNLKSSSVDFIIGISIVLLSYFSGTELQIVHILLAILYTVWLIIIKPKNTEKWCIAQSLIAIFMGSTAVILLTADLDVSIVVLSEFIIGYSSARHILAQLNTGKSPVFPTLAYGILVAELSWIFRSWNIIYPINFGKVLGMNIGIMIPQFSIIITIITFTLIKTLTSIARNEGKFNKSEALPPIIFATVTIIVIIAIFSNPIFNI